MSEELNNDTIMLEIEEAVNSMDGESAKEVNEPVKTGEEEGATAVEKQEAATDTPFVADDALIERAVKAGLSMADAKAFASKEQAENILKALEAKAEVSKSKEEPNEPTNKGAGFPAEFDKMMTEIEEDGDYDPKLVSMFKSLGSLLKSQQDTIAALKSARDAAEGATDFDKGFNGLDSGVREHINAATKSQLKSKFDFLVVAHKSAKDGMKVEEIFDEAKRLVLGDIIRKAEEDDKAKVLAERRRMSLARPVGEGGAKPTAQEGMSEEQIADALFQKLTK